MKPQVILRHCDQYDPERIAAILSEGMEALDVRPQGRVLVKPNLVLPHPRFFPHCFTRPEFMDGLLRAVRARGEELDDLVVGERSGLSIPSRMAFAEAGYLPVLRHHHARPEYFDEYPSVPVQLHHPQALRPLIYVARGVTRCDFLVNAAKFKAHTWLKVTFALKNYIGIQDDAHKLIDHDHKLAHKIADLQEVVQPGFIAIDGITAGEYSEINSHPFPLRLIIMGRNPVAVDAVCTHIAGLEPSEVDYIRMTAGRGYGPLDLDEIDVTGDVTLGEARVRAQGFSLTLDRVDEYMKGRGNLTAYVGRPPDTYDYCSGGCPGALVFATQIVEAFQPEMHQKVRPMSFIFGAYQGEIHPKDGEPVLAMGDCAEWSGQIRGQDVDIRSVYVPREQRDPHQAHMKDAVGQILTAVVNVIRQRRQPVMRIRGCPVAVMQYLWYLHLLGRTINPALHPRILPAYAYHYVVHKVVRTARRIAATLRGQNRRQAASLLAEAQTGREKDHSY